ncbi:MAG: cation tolerance protein CutA [Burkholderiaceae bacterium]|nr:cation tolerance protein CutA [Burkholderiaceae bacterium]
MPDTETAQKIAQALVGRQLAACVNILPGVQSVYRWQGKVEQAQEISLLIKTRRACYAAVEAVVGELHPYEVPEIIALPINAGLPKYLEWLAQETAPPHG